MKEMKKLPTSKCSHINRGCQSFCFVATLVDILVYFLVEMNIFIYWISIPLANIKRNNFTTFCMAVMFSKLSRSGLPTLIKSIQK